MGRIEPADGVVAIWFAGLQLEDDGWFSGRLKCCNS